MTLWDWRHESCDRRDDPVSGARIIQLTSAAAISNNVYGEQPYGSPDGKRIVIIRGQDPGFDRACSILAHDLDTLRLRLAVPRAPVSVRRNLFHSGWSEHVCYWTSRRQLMRLSLSTLKQEVAHVEEDPRAALPAETVSPDRRYVVGLAMRLRGKGAPVFQIVRLDLQTRRRDVILEQPDLCAHLQHDPVTGREILFQNNVGARLKKDGSVEIGDTVDLKLSVIDADGSNRRERPAARPATLPGTGHECFLADTGRVLFSVGWERRSDYDWRHDPRWSQGNLFTAGPGDDRPAVFAAPEHRFNHVSASRCGRYFVADSHTGPGLFENGRIKPVALVVGNLNTGKYRVLVEDTEASGGGNQCTHTHPYLTADNRHVIYNSDGYGVPQVMAARIPAGFLASLN